MAFVEEVAENNGKLYGQHTGKEYSRSETEKIGPCTWSKPAGCAPGEIVLEAPEPPKQSWK
jgi:hypothetical protein